MVKSLIKNSFTILLFSFFIYIILIFYFDWELVILSFQKFPILTIPLLLFLSFLTLLSRYFKWRYYLNILNLKIPFIISAKIFFASLSMGITPGKWGELLKSFLIKEKFGIKIIQTAPIVLAERFTDLGSLLIIVMLGAVIFNYGLELVVFITIGFLIIYFLIISKKILEKIIYKLSQFKFFKSLEFTNGFIDVTYILMAPKPFLIMTIYSLTSWFFECFGFYIILSNFEVDISLNWTSFSYALATLVSSLTFLPGGIGATEGSLTYLLIQRGMIESDAVVSVFILRLVTLWFSVLVGAVTLAFYNKTEKINISKILSEGVNNGKV